MRLLALMAFVGTVVSIHAPVKDATQVVFR